MNVYLQGYKRILQSAIAAFDFVIIDTPPLGLFIDAAVVAALVDGTIVTIGSGKTTAAEVKEALSQLEKAQARVIGAVLNGVKSNKTNYYYYYDKQGNKSKKKSSNS